MQIARDLAGFSMGQADVLRKAMGKKIASLLAEQKEKFIEGCVKNGVYQELGEKVFSFIEPFAGYGFNRSHAACYALIGYQTAYLKAHWPTEFMAALLTSDQGDTDRVAIEIEECRHMGIKIMAPDVNESFGTFTVVTAGTKENRAVKANEVFDTIRFGLKAVKNVGEHIVDEIIRVRKEDGPYKDIFDLLERITDKDLNKKSLESLTKSGALDSFGERGQLLANIEKMLSFNKEIAKSKDNKQTSLFADLPTISWERVPLAAAPAADKNEKLAWEKELLGLYVSEHPMNSFRPYLTGYARPLIELAKQKGDDRLVAAGVVSTIKKILTHKGESMLFVKVEDASGLVEFLVFPRTLKETADIWQVGRAVIVDGKISEKDQETKILVNRVLPLDPLAPQQSIDKFKKLLLDSQAPATYRRNGSNGNGAYNNGAYSNNHAYQPKPAAPKKPIVPAKPAVPVAPKKSAPLDQPLANPLLLTFTGEIAAADLEKLRRIFAAHPGNNAVRFRTVQGGKAIVVRTAFLVDNSPDLRAELAREFTAAMKISG